MSNPSNVAKTALKGAIALAHDVKTHPQAKEQFEELHALLEPENAEMADLLKHLWQEYITLQRSAAFWQKLSNAEKELSDRVAENNIQLQQNYLRLMQEQ
ncbi:MAG TPA: hypothetical protein V6D29_00280 [Leptolyngbyaceae cyanobacterium]